jgi:hypothetical protein
VHIGYGLPVARNRAIGAVFISELQAGEAVRALHFWNRAQRPRPLGPMCVVARGPLDRVRYLPYRIPTAGGGAWRGLLLGLVAGGALGAGAGSTMGAVLSSTMAGTRSAADAVISLLGRSPGFDVHGTIAMAGTSSLNGALALGAGFAVAGALVGAVLGAILGAVGRALRGFGRSARRGVVDLLRPGGGADVAWARGEDEAALAELRRLGGESWPDLLPPKRSVPFIPTAESAEGGQRSA